VLYLRDATHIDWRTLEVTRGHLAVEPGEGGAVRTVGEIPAGGEVFDCAGKLVSKSFAIGHHHIYSALARGMPPPARTPRSFVEILELIWWRLDKALDTEMIRASAMVAGLEAARCGTTFIIDHHASPNAAEGSLHVIAETLDQVGLGHLLCYELSDRDGAERMEQGFAESAAYAESHQALVGLHASFTVSEELLGRAVELARAHGTGIHIHVAEAESDEEDCRAKHGKSIAKRLKDAGALNLPATLLAHCLHLDDEERSIVANSAAWVVHNTQSNQNNNVGRFDPRGLGERVFIGTDGMHSDMLSATSAAYLEGQAAGGVSPLDAYRRMRRVHDYLDTNGFTGDGDNTLVVLDYPSPTPVTADNWAGHVVYGLRSAHVHTVIAGGRVIVENRRHVSIDEERELAIAREQAERLWKKLGVP